MPSSHIFENNNSFQIYENPQSQIMRLIFFIGSQLFYIGLLNRNSIAQEQHSVNTAHLYTSLQIWMQVTIFGGLRF